MAEVTISCNATQYSVTETTLVLSGSDPSLNTVTIGYHAGTSADNTGTYGKNSAILRMTNAEFVIAVDAFSDLQPHGVTLCYESTLKKNNVKFFSCPNEEITFKWGTTTVVAVATTEQQVAESV